MYVYLCAVCGTIKDNDNDNEVDAAFYMTQYYLKMVALKNIPVSKSQIYINPM